MLIVNDLVIDVDRRSERLECQIQTGNRHIDARAETARAGQNNSHDHLFRSTAPPPGTGGEEVATMIVYDCGIGKCRDMSASRGGVSCTMESCKGPYVPCSEISPRDQLNLETSRFTGQPVGSGTVLTCRRMGSTRDRRWTR